MSWSPAGLLAGLRLPADEADVLSALTEAWQRAVAERVEIACAGGHGRTGTALACLAILNGVPGTEAVPFVRGALTTRTQSRRPVSAAMSPGGPPGDSRVASAWSTEAATSRPESTNMGAWA